MVKRKRMKRLPKALVVVDDFSKSLNKNLKSAVKGAGLKVKRKKK